MRARQIRWRGTVLTVTVILVIAAAFALATVTSNADTSYDPETRTYTMTGGEYDQQIILDHNNPTTMVVSGENRLTYGADTGNSLFNMYGDLIITGKGSVEIATPQVGCTNLTVKDGAKLILAAGLITDENVTVDNAEIEAPNAYLNLGNKWDKSQHHVFNNARITIGSGAGPKPPSYYDKGLIFYGDVDLNNCTVTAENTPIIAGTSEYEPNTLTINGGTYNINYTSTNASPSLNADFKAVINDAVIKTNAPCKIQNLEMKNTSFESTFAGMYPAIRGTNLVFSGSKVNIDGYALLGVVAINKLIIAGNTEMNVKSNFFGIVGKDVQIKHSGGKIQATAPTATAAVSANTIGFYEPSVIPGTITLDGVYVTEPAGATIGKVTIVPPIGTISRSDDPVTITTIMDGDAAAKTVVLGADHTTHTWDAGKVTKEPTETAEGVKTYTCTVCGATRTESIPKLSPKGSQGSATGVDGTPFGKGASVQAAEAAILALPNDNDPAGTAFGLLQLKATKVTKNSIKLNWKAVPGATKYILFANKCGTGNKYKKLGEVTGTSFTATQAAGAAIQKGTYYKFMMIAADSQGKVISTSKTVHAATKGGKVGNHKKVTVKKSVTKKAKKLKAGKTLKLKAKAVPQAKKLKVRKHRGIMYETSNPAVAQVNGKGTVKGVGKGTFYIYAYAQNGTCAKVKVTVK